MFSIRFLFCNKREGYGVIKSVTLFSPKTSEPRDKILRQAYMNNLPLDAKHNFKFMLLKLPTRRTQYEWQQQHLKE